MLQFIRKLLQKKNPSELSHNQFGDWAERVAEKFLKKKNMKPITKNYRCSFGEIDLIMQDEDYVVFVEVKAVRAEETRPESHMNKNKRMRLIKAAKTFITKYNFYDAPVRFDIITIRLKRDNSNDVEIEYVENAFGIR